MKNGYILVETGDDHICRITLNRPENMNIFNTPMAKELNEALRAADRDENVRVIVLTGAGKAFCVSFPTWKRCPIGSAFPPVACAHTIELYCWKKSRGPMPC